MCVCLIIIQELCLKYKREVLNTIHPHKITVASVKSHRLPKPNYCSVPSTVNRTFLIWSWFGKVQALKPLGIHEINIVFSVTINYICYVTNVDRYVTYKLTILPSLTSVSHLVSYPMILLQVQRLSFRGSLLVGTHNCRPGTPNKTLRFWRCLTQLSSYHNLPMSVSPISLCLVLGLFWMIRDQSQCHGQGD